MQRDVERGRALDLPNRPAYAYAPIVPYLKKAITIRRAGSRAYKPQDILLPSGYVADVVATGFSTPVHCCFDDGVPATSSNAATRSRRAHAS